jgi:hypothetical protein
VPTFIFFIFEFSLTVKLTRNEAPDAHALTISPSGKRAVDAEAFFEMQLKRGRELGPARGNNGQGWLAGSECKEVSSSDGMILQKCNINYQSAINTVICCN